MEQNLGSDLSVEAGEDLSSYQFYAIQLYNGLAYLADGDPAGIVIGILQNKPTLGQAAQIRHACGSKSKIKLYDTVAANAHVKANGGKLDATTTAGDRILGIVTVGGNANELGELLLEPGYYPKS